MNREVPLQGGKHGQVVKVGRTVRRASGPWSPTVLDLLGHLRSCGFDGAPRPLGFDSRGRETLAYIDGTAGPPLPDPGSGASPPADHWVWRDEVLSELGGLLRRAHDAAASFPQAGRTWQLDPVLPAETICHNDVSPWNTIFENGLPVALIDWESAAPAPRSADLGFAAWRWVPLWPDDACHRVGLPTGVSHRARRIGVLFDGYGRRPDEASMIAAADRVQRFHDHLEVLVAAGSAWEVELAERGVLDQIDDQVRFIRAHAAALTRGRSDG